MLWSEDSASFLPHGLAGGVDDARQPILLSTSEDSPNQARNMLIADGQWRDSALTFDRAFFLFGEDKVEDARLALETAVRAATASSGAIGPIEDGKWVHKA